MAEGDDSASKTEEPSARKLEEARKQGDVPKSQDLAHVFALAGAFGAVVMAGGGLAHNLVIQLTPFIAHPDTMQLQGEAGVAVTWQVISAAAPVLATVFGATILGGVSGNLIQTGVMFTPAKLQPDLSKISLAQGFKRLFSLDSAMNFLRSALKVILVSAIAWWVLAPRTNELPALVTVGPVGMVTYSLGIGKSLMFAVIALLALGGVLDFVWQRQRFMSKMKMTKEETKEEFKQTEGDPRVKGRQRQLRMERARRRMIQNVPKATVVVVNPTHFAVALRYVQGETPAPQCVAKGVDAVALRIREVGEEHGVPVVEDPPLARALYSAVEIDQTIPVQHYEAVAKVIGFILSGRKRRARAL
jgi:flagellar biosynthetic protein FlhB